MSGWQFWAGKAAQHNLYYETRLLLYSRAEEEYEMQNRIIYQLVSN
jgi:hypothetical protein